MSILFTHKEVIEDLGKAFSKAQNENDWVFENTGRNSREEEGLSLGRSRDSTYVVIENMREKRKKGWLQVQL